MLIKFVELINFTTIFYTVTFNITGPSNDSVSVLVLSIYLKVLFRFY